MYALCNCCPARAHARTYTCNVCYRSVVVDRQRRQHRCMQQRPPLLMCPDAVQVDGHTVIVKRLCMMMFSTWNVCPLCAPSYTVQFARKIHALQGSPHLSCHTHIYMVTASNGSQCAACSFQCRPTSIQNAALCRPMTTQANHSFIQSCNGTVWEAKLGHHQAVCCDYPWQSLFKFHTLSVTIYRICQSPIRIWLANSLLLHLTHHPCQTTSQEIQQPHCYPPLHPN